jgi:hypothetical protein
MADTETTIPSRVECLAKKDPAVRLFIFAAMLIGFGLWCFVDAYVKKVIPLPKPGELNSYCTYYMNTIGGILLPIAGLVPLVRGIMAMRRVLVADEAGIGYVGKPPVAWADVESLDASKLADKSILKLNLADGGTLVLDGYELENFKPLIKLVEAKVVRP